MLCNVTVIAALTYVTRKAELDMFSCSLPGYAPVIHNRLCPCHPEQANCNHCCVGLARKICGEVQTSSYRIDCTGKEGLVCYLRCLGRFLLIGLPIFLAIFASHAESSNLDSCLPACVPEECITRRAETVRHSCATHSGNFDDRTQWHHYLQCVHVLDF